MNLCDRPTEVVTGEYWVDKQIPRVPIIVTGNDLSRLYAPLIRDGRMDKFYWQPDRSEMTQMLLRLFEADGLSQIECEGLVDAFPDQVPPSTTQQDLKLMPYCMLISVSEFYLSVRSGTKTS